GLWSLGMPKNGIEAFLTFSDVVARQPQIIDSMLRFTRGCRRILIAPKLAASESITFDRADIRVFGLSECLRADPAHIIPTLDIGGLDVAKPTPRLIVQIGKQTVVLDGTELKLPPRSFRLLHYLAQQAVAGRALCERRDIEKFLWSTVVSDKA